MWVPDQASRQRRELLHLYGKAVADHTAAGNSLRAFLNGNAIGPAKRNLELESTRQWILKQRALLAVIGDVRRFERPEKLVAYIGLNPGQRQSGTGKNIKLDMGKRGRGTSVISSFKGLTPFCARAAPQPWANGLETLREKATAMSPSPLWPASSWSRSGTCSRATVSEILFGIGSKGLRF